MGGPKELKEWHCILTDSLDSFGPAQEAAWEYMRFWLLPRAAEVGIVASQLFKACKGSSAMCRKRFFHWHIGSLLTSGRSLGSPFECKLVRGVLGRCPTATWVGYLVRQARHCVRVGGHCGAR